MKKRTHRYDTQKWTVQCNCTAPGTTRLKAWNLHESRIGISLPCGNQPAIHPSGSYPLPNRTIVKHVWRSNSLYKAFDQVLDGMFNCPSECDPMAACLLCELAQPQEVTQIPDHQLEEVMLGWKKAWEITLSSPSSIHFGHYMAGNFNPTIAIFYASLADIRMSSGYSLKWWCTSLNIMLQKQARNRNVDKLCIILLFETDCNQNHKWLGQAVMCQAEQLGLLTQEQYGSCNQKSAAIQCLNKRLVYDYIWFTSIMLKQCQKWLWLHSTRNRSLEFLQTWCIETSCSKHALNITWHGPSLTLNLQWFDHVPKQQGLAKTNCGNRAAGPSIWAAISTPLFKALNMDGFLATFICTLSLHQQSLAGFGFVDDTDLCISDSTNQVAQVAEKMQQSLSLWAKLLHANGGVLVPEKCFWYLLDLQWAHGKWEYTLNNDKFKLQIDKDSGAATQLPLLPASEACRTLSVHLALDGSVEMELNHLISIAKTWQSSMNKAKLTHSAAEFSIQQVILHNLEYPLITTTSSRAQCNQIMRPILWKGPPLAGFIKTFPQALVHGPYKWGGINIPHLFTEQLYLHIHTLLKFGNKLTNVTGSLIACLCKSLRLEMGFTGNLFDTLVCMQPCLTGSWLTQTWEDCHMANIHIVASLPDIPRPHVNDIKLMHTFIRSGFCNSELCTLNRCRMYLQVFFLSDMCTKTGDWISSKLWTHPTPLPSNFRWPRTVKPSPQEWATWQWAITQSLSLGCNQTLPLPLGPWLRWHEVNTWYYNPLDLALFHQNQGVWTTYTPIPKCTRHQLFHIMGCKIRLNIPTSPSFK